MGNWEVQWAGESSPEKAEGYLIKTMVGAGLIANLGSSKTREACDNALKRVRSGEKASEVVFSEVSKLFSSFPFKQREHKFTVLSAFIENEVMR